MANRGVNSPRLAAQHAVKWEQKYAALQEFYAKYGRCPKSSESYNEINLGTWVCTQRQYAKRGLLSAERREKLLALGIELRPMDIITRANSLWDKKFDLLLEFHQKYGRFPMSTESYKGENIGTWFRNQRQQAKNGELAKDRENRLLALGPVLEPLDSLTLRMDRLDATWDKKFDILQKFYAEYGRCPTHRETYMGESIGTWLNTQRQLMKRGELAAKRKDKIREFGIDLKATDMAAHRNSLWEKKLAILQEFYATYGKFPKQSDTYKGDNIGTWLNNQRRLANKGVLPVDRIMKLIDVGAIAPTTGEKTAPVSTEK